MQPAESILTDGLKEQIQQAYSNWLKARGFRARRSQREMIAEIAKTLAADDPAQRFCVVEAGTGTGKTIAYLIALVPLARAMHRKIVVATATVALQEQLVNRDLPDLAEASQLQFSWSLAKGRRRYVCLYQLNARLDRPLQAGLDLGQGQGMAGGEDPRPRYAALLDDFMAGRWPGDRDSLKESIDDGDWQRVTVDGRGCTGPRCSFFRECPYFRAREEHAEADVVVANHDLVLADAAIGGAVLPDPEDVLYVFDEGHHLPVKAREHFRASARLGGTSEWLESLTTALGTIAQHFGQAREFVEPAKLSVELAAGIGEELKELEELVRALPFGDDDAGEVHRFRHGLVPGPVAEAAAPLARSSGQLVQFLESYARQLERVMDGDLAVPSAHEAEDFNVVVATHQARAEAARTLFEAYRDGAEEDPAIAPAARWARRLPDEDDFLLESGPVVAAEHLIEHLWGAAAGVLVTSATLRMLGHFEPYLVATGLAPDTTTVLLPSPFNYPELGKLRVPAMASDPGDRGAHTEEVGRMLPDLCDDSQAVLVLFTSWWQMRTVLEVLPPALREAVLVQGDYSRQQMLDMHRERIDAGERSVLFGLASFAEGVDLPGGYVTHVIITKLPFMVPDDPLTQAQAEWVVARGGNAFQDMSLPEASLRLTQAAGRLIRSEDDEGVITLLDRRVVTRRYGRQLLDALPPFAREIDRG